MTTETHTAHTLRTTRTSRGIRRPLHALALACAICCLGISVEAAGDENINIGVRGLGDNGNGTSFVAQSKYIVNESQRRIHFKIRKGLPDTDYTFCVSTDNCTFKMVLTTSAHGRVKVRLSSNKGNLPPDLPDIQKGDTLFVNGQEIGTYQQR